ncbi:MAG: hypothetical protein HWD61_04475 [Parachlamydiaceae bacterium]|nr:MAG: hypothetical protein HWD61_04475 [Parachlamydiaceae bacterium]
MPLAEIDKLELDLEEQWESNLYYGTPKTYTLRDAVTDVLKYLNKNCKKASQQVHIKKARCGINLPTSERPFSIYQNLGLPPEQPINTFEDSQKLWLNRILGLY